MEPNTLFRHRLVLPLAGLLLLGVPQSVNADVPIPAESVVGISPSLEIQTLVDLAEAGNPLGLLDRINRFKTAEAASNSFPEGPETDFLRAAALFHSSSPEALTALENFARRYPASPDNKPALLMIGDCYFFDKEYQDAMMWYMAADPASAPIDSDIRNLYSYRLAVSRLRNGLADNETAELIRSFSQNKSYRIPAIYYKAYYDYLNRNYEKALEGFERVAEELARTDVNSEGMAPLYYIAQINYRNLQYDDVISLGRSLMVKNPVPELLPELMRVVGLSYFKKGNKVQARGLLEKYVDSALADGYTPADDAVYSLAVCEYEAGDFRQALERFTTLTEIQDITGQGAWYYLGEIAMKDGRYDEAVIDYRKAARMSFDGPVAERAAYNCIAAVTHGGNSPFLSTTDMYEEFLRDWPGSKYADDIRRGLYQAYAVRNDYDNALAVLDAISYPDERVKAERQKLLYAKGTRLERAGRHKEAAKALSEAVRTAADPNLTAEAGIWLGDALYGSGDYPGSVAAFNRALSSGKSLGTERRTSALYQRAYSNMRSERYSDAARDFSEVLREGKGPKDIIADARLRLADCQYYSGNLSGAAETYREVRELDSDEADYATMRLALLAGLSGDRASETAMLREFLRNSPDSPVRSEAISRLGSSLEAQGKNEEAIEQFDLLLKQYPTSSFAREGALKASRLSSKVDNADKSAERFRRVIELWPTSDEAAEADLFLRDYYGRNGRLDDYVRFLASVKGAPRIEASEMEEITFRAAERAYVADPDDTSSLENYISRYPKGIHIPSALLWIANSRFDAGRSREALDAVNRIISDYPDSREADDARLLKEDLAEYSELFEAIEKADSSRDRKTGLESLKKLALNSDSPVGAQANVELAERLLKSGKINDALTVLEDFTSSGTPQQYWLARGFLLLADVHHAEGKDWLAKEYVISLRDNYPGSEKEIADGIAERLSRYSGSGNAAKSPSTSTRKSRKRK